MTIDDLAHRSGTAASTIRLYQTRGLLPPPAKQGRVGFYGEGHLARLRLIAQLQNEGFSLAGIRRLVEAWETGRGLDAVLGLEAQIAATWGDEEPLRVSPGELAARFPDGEISPDVIQRTVSLGLAGVDGDHIVINSPRFLEIGSELARMGLPIDEIIDEYERLQAATSGVAERFTQLFERHLWAPLVESGLPGGEVRRLTEGLQRLSALAAGVVTLALRQSLKRAASTFLATQAEEFQSAGVLDTIRPLAAAAGPDLDADP